MKYIEAFTLAETYACGGVKCKLFKENGLWWVVTNNN